MTEIMITAEERNDIWDLTEFAFNGASERLAREDGVDRGRVSELKQWFQVLDVIGYERKVEGECLLPLSLSFIGALDAAEREALGVLGDASKTFARGVQKLSAEEVGKQFLPPVEGDEEGAFLVGYCQVKAVRERMEDAEPRLKQGGSR